MKIPVVGFDPSMSGWGIAEGNLDLATGLLEIHNLLVIEPEKIKTKQVRQNSSDLYVAEQLAVSALASARRACILFAEVPVGSQSARAMCSYGLCVGILGAIRAEGINVIEVTASEVKSRFTGNKNASKKEMIAQAVKLYPDANFPRIRGRITDKAEHVADAIGAIHAGTTTPLFQNLKRLYQEGIHHADHHRSG